MSNYTSIFIYPVDEKFRPAESTLYKIFDFLMVSLINCVTGSNPCNGDEEEEDNVFFLEKITLDKVIENINTHLPSTTFMMFSSEYYLYNLCQSLIDTIPAELANNFVPWDSSMTIGAWKARDYNTDDVVAKGIFCIQKSSYGCPSNLRAYLDAFTNNPEVQKLLQFLELETSCKWNTCIQLS
jgi:hypothetical protein